MLELQNYNEKTFDDIKHIDEFGNEYWEARELQKVLEYSKWENFQKVIEKAIITCNASKYNTLDHFVEFNKIVEAGATTKAIIDYKLSRYACYLIVQNGDSKKEVIADIGGTMLERLPTPDKSLKELEKENKNKLID